MLCGHHEWLGPQESPSYRPVVLLCLWRPWAMGHGMAFDVLAMIHFENVLAISTIRVLLISIQHCAGTVPAGTVSS